MNKRKIVCYLIIISCLLLSIGVFLLSTKRSGGIDSLNPREKIWMICTDKDCGDAFEVNKIEYYKWVKMNRAGLYIPPMVCEKCEKETAHRAIKCDQCGFVFVFMSTDHCPKCNYSKIEELKGTVGNRTSVDKGSDSTNIE